jgi:hypothetical protein
MAEGRDEEQGKGFEMLCGVLIAVFAAVLAITDLGAGKYGDDELIAHNEKGAAYLWYQSKGIKETLVEGQRDTLQALVSAGTIRPEQLPAIDGMVRKLDGDVKRYGKEKKEILLGSDKVGKANWAQDVGGKMGQVTGASEWEAKSNVLNEVGDTFDYADFFLQLCLVFGAISLVLQAHRMRTVFFRIMIALGAAGTVFAVLAFWKGSGVP